MRILISIHCDPPIYKCSVPLQAITKVETASLPVIIKLVWKYITTEGLQDTKDRTVINCHRHLKYVSSSVMDKELAVSYIINTSFQIIDKESIKFSELLQYITRHIGPPDPISINYTIHTSSFASKEVIRRVPIETIDTLGSKIPKFLMSNSHREEITKLDVWMV